MKIRFLDDGLYKPFKCGETIALGLGSVIGGIANGLISANSSAEIANKNIKAQQNENAFNRAWQTEQAEIARQYNTAEREASQQFAIDQMNAQNAYNDPSAQVERFRAAGINPAVALSKNVTSVSSNPSPSSPASSPVPSPPPSASFPAPLRSSTSVTKRWI